MNAEIGQARASRNRSVRAGWRGISAPGTHRHLILAAVLALLVFSVGVAQQPHTLTGDVRLHKDFHSQVLNNNRDIIVYLPPGYDSDSKRRYSVLYFHDGQNLFDGATSYIPGQEWRLDETAQGLIAREKLNR